MRILMFGRGVIATIYGRVLQQAGHHVEFYVRPGRSADHGEKVRIDLIDGRGSIRGRRERATFDTRLRESIEPGDVFDLVVLSVAHHRLAEASAYLAPRIGQTTVLVLGNIWDEPRAAIAPLAPEQVVFGFPQAGGGFGSDGVLHGALLRSIILGTADSARAVAVHALFRRAGLTVRAQKDMRGWLWLHFASDAGMFAQALQRGGLANMIGDRDAFRDAFLAGRELLPVLEKRGVDLRQHPAAMIPYRLPAVTASLSAWASARFPIAQASLAAHTDPHAAEPHAVLDDALRTARRLGIETPRLERSVRAA